MPKLVQFGAGNIGRSFIGQLFARGGYEVVFVDVDDGILAALNERRSYRVEVRDTPPGELLVANVRAVDGRDRDAVVAELLSTNLAGTAVGANALRFLYPNLAAALQERQRQNKGPLDIILCENLHGAATIVEQGLKESLPETFPLQDYLGLVETSIGKMVPLMSPSLREQDPLLVCAEAYNTLIVDRLAFKNPFPAVPGLEGKTNMSAYVDRKLYIHNLGHAAVAYEAARLFPHLRTVGEAVTHPEVHEAAEGAMRESAAALVQIYPQEFTAADLEAHIQDLLRRFANPALGDTIYRVGRDVRRKLARTDRIVGAMLMDLSQNITPVYTARAAASALKF
nr:mannitol-1-phosphate 5-dehydrogenase [Armatimonadota bacterium]